MNCRWREPPDQAQTSNQPGGRYKKLCRPPGFSATQPIPVVHATGRKCIALRAEAIRKTFEVNDGVKPIQARRASEWFLQAEEPLARASGLYFHAAHAGLLTNVSNSWQTSFTRSVSCPNNSRHASMSTGAFPAVDSRRPAVSLAVKAPR